MQINIDVDAMRFELKKAWSENPLGVLAVAGVCVSGTAKLLNALTWRKEVNRRRKMTK
jgi:hypothetical protein